MDRYGASSRHYDNEYSDSYDSRPADSDPGYGRSRRGAAERTRRGDPPMRSRYADSESDDDENYGRRRRVRSARDRNTFEGERGGRDFGSRLEPTDSRRAPHGTSDRRDVVPHASDEFPPNERAQVPRGVHSRRDARIEGRRFDEDSYGGEAVVDSATRHGPRMPRGDGTPPPPSYYSSDSETELGGRHVRAPGARRGAEPRSRFDDDHSGRRGTRGGHGRGDRRRMEPRSGGNRYDTTSSDDESDSTSDGYNTRSRY